MPRTRVSAHITESTSKGFGLDVQVRRGVTAPADAKPSLYPSGVPFNDGSAATQPGGKGPLQPGNSAYREVIPPGVIGSEEYADMQLPGAQYVDTVPSYPTEQNDVRLHGPMAALRGADTNSIGFNDYASFQPRTAPLPRAVQDELYHRGPGKNVADPRMTDENSFTLLLDKDYTDRCDLYGRNVAGVLHNPLIGEPASPTQPTTNQATTRSTTSAVGRGKTRTGHGKRPPELADQVTPNFQRAADDKDSSPRGPSIASTPFKQTSLGAKGKAR